MTSRSFKTGTAAIALLSLLQPLPAISQSSADADAGTTAPVSTQPDRLANGDMRPFDEICAEAMILDASACALHIEALQAMSRAEAAADAAAQAAIHARAAQQAAVVADDALKAEAEALAEELTRAAVEAEAQAVKEAEVAARLAQEAQAAAQAAAEAQAQAATAAEVDAQTRSNAEIDAQDEAEAQAEADALAEINAQASTDAQEESDAEASAATRLEEEPDATVADEAEAQTLPVVEDCAAEVVASDGTLTCVDTLTSEGLAALAAGADVETGTRAEVTTETVAENDRRSSDEEFTDRSQDEADEGATASDDRGELAGTQRDASLSDLEKAGLFVLGAVVVGAILSNGQRVVTNTGDRVIVVDDEGSYQVLKDDDALLGQPGSEVRTERFSDGSTRTTVTRDDGTRIITIRDATGRALHRLRIEPDGREYLLIDDTRNFEPVIVRDLPMPTGTGFDYGAATDRESLRLALLAADSRDIGRSFSLRQVRDYVEVRELAPEINLAGITFATNSARIQPSQAEQLREIGLLMRDFIRDDPTEMFLVEGHTDAIGRTGHNLLLSDRRAESVALALTEYFGVRPENMIVQGYGESQLKIPSQEAERLNRRVAVRRISPLLSQQGN